MNIRELKDLIEDLPDDMEVFKDATSKEMNGNKWSYPIFNINSRLTIKKSRAN